MAVKVAEKSNHYQHKIGSLIIKGGSIISMGYNTDHIHAEHTAINRAWENGVKGCSILVVRIRRDGTLGMAKPCGLCSERLIEAGIKKIIYSDTNGELVHLNTNQIEQQLTPNQLFYHFVKPHHSPKILNHG